MAHLWTWAGAAAMAASLYFRDRGLINDADGFALLAIFFALIGLNNAKERP